jgi:hypothetical protein
VENGFPLSRSGVELVKTNFGYGFGFDDVKIVHGKN